MRCDCARARANKTRTLRLCRNDNCFNNIHIHSTYICIFYIFYIYSLLVKKMRSTLFHLRSYQPHPQKPFASCRGDGGSAVASPGHQARLATTTIHRHRPWQWRSSNREHSGTHEPECITREPCGKRSQQSQRATITGGKMSISMDSREYTRLFTTMYISYTIY